MKKILSALVAVALSVPACMGLAADLPAAAPFAAVPHRYVDLEEQDGQDLAAARQAILELERADAGLSRFFDRAAGFAVFPVVGRGLVGRGGAHGTGVLFENGLPIGMSQLTQPAVGLQRGAKAYTEVVFFETRAALADFQRGGFTMGSQVDSLAAASGASASGSYVQGLSVYTLSWGVPMAEAGVGGQRFAYRPFPTRLVTSAR
jgi:lipid-binding SYLF domain-containing protein